MTQFTVDFVLKFCLLLNRIGSSLKGEKSRSRNSELCFGVLPFFQDGGAQTNKLVLYVSCNRLVSKSFQRIFITLNIFSIFLALSLRILVCVFYNLVFGHVMLRPWVPLIRLSVVYMRLRLDALIGE